MEGFIDVPYTVLKEAVTRIEKKKGTCKKLPSARFSWRYSRVTGGKIQVGEHMPNLDGPDEFSEIMLTCLCCNEMAGLSTGIQAEECQNCLKKKKT